jgi:hypothetical protein
MFTSVMWMFVKLPSMEPSPLSPQPGRRQVFAVGRFGHLFAVG